MEKSNSKDTFFKERNGGEWRWRIPKEDKKNETGSSLIGNPDIVQDVKVLNKLKSSDHIFLRSGL